MSIFNDKTTKSVAEAAAKIMEAELSAKQKAIAKLDEPKHKIDAGDLAKLRAGHKPVKEDVEQIDEINEKQIKRDIDSGMSHDAVIGKHANKKMINTNEIRKVIQQHAWDKRMKKPVKEDVEQIDEVSYSAKKARAGEDIGKPGKMFAKIAAGAAKRYGSEERGKKVAGAVLAKLRKEETEEIQEGDNKQIKDGDPCWKGYQMVGMKNKGGKKVPNCVPTNEEKEHEDEAQDKEMCTGIAKKEVKKHETRMHKEDVEQLVEYESKSGVYKHKGTYGTEKGAEYGETDWEKENKDAKKMTKAPRKLGPRQNFVRSTRVNESFTEMIKAYDENGLKAFVKPIQEEPDNETFTKELEDQKASMMGKKKQPSVAAAATQGVKTMPEEIEVLDANEINGVTIQTIEERTLSEPETKKKEEVVKSMKKKLPGFKERYGERAKSVLYATATRIAKEKA